MKQQNKGLRDTPKSRVPSQEYLDNWDRIFGNKKKEQENKSK